MKNYLKRFIVASLEQTCSWVWDPILNHFDGMSWLAYDVLDIPMCWLARWSCTLEQRWHTGYWKPTDEAESDVVNV